MAALNTSGRCTSGHSQGGWLPQFGNLQEPLRTVYWRCCSALLGCSFLPCLYPSFSVLKGMVPHLSLPALTSIPTCPRKDQLPLDSANTPSLMLMNPRKPQLNRISDNTGKWRAGSLRCKQSRGTVQTHKHRTEQQQLPEILGLQKRSCKSLGKLWELVQQT